VMVVAGNITAEWRGAWDLGGVTAGSSTDSGTFSPPTAQAKLLVA